LSVFQRSAIQGGKTRSKVGEDGLSIAQKASIKANHTRRQIGEDGLDSYQRGMIKSKKTSYAVKRYNDDLVYQGTNEKDFLDRLKLLNLLCFIKNGFYVKYDYFGKQKDYKPDFIFKDIIFEVKSKWTYDNHDNYDGKLGLELRVVNHLKWMSCLKQGYRVIIIIEKDFYFEVEESDFDDVEKSLIFKKQALPNQYLSSLFL
jgi:hypothetical protein